MPPVAIVSLLLLLLGAVAMAAGLDGATRGSEIRWAFVLLALAGAAVLGGSVHGLFAWRDAVRLDDDAERAQPGASHALAGPVLAHWTYDPAEWNAYTRRQLVTGTRQALVMWVLVFALVTTGVGMLHGEWRVAAIMSGVLATSIAVGRWMSAIATCRRHRAVPTGDVIIGTHAVLVNRRCEVTHGGGRIHFGGARVLEAERPAILQVDIMDPGKPRSVRVGYRIPIPSGREEEARAVARELAGAHTST